MGTERRPRHDRRTSPGGPHRHRPGLAAALLAGAVLAAGTGAAWQARAVGRMALDPAGQRIAEAAGGPGRLGDPLPKGPPSARVYTARGRVPQSEVERLAAALGVAGPVVSGGGVWRAGAPGGPALQVDRNGPGSWVYTRSGARCGLPAATGRARAAVPCYAAGRSGGKGRAAAPERDGPRSAASLLTALGLRGARVDASRTAGTLRTVTADPLVGGLPTSGWSTVLQIAPDGSVASASGRLLRPVPGRTYPVLGAAAAFARLSGAGPRAGGCRPGGAPCRAGRPPLRLRGAVFGLSAQYPHGVPTLVPSWLFRVAAYGARGDALVAQPAVDLRPGAGVRSGAPANRGPRAVRIESYKARGAVLTLRFWGGLCSSYAASLVGRSPDGVLVRVMALPPRPQRQCPLLARRMTARLLLPEALGPGAVLRDAATGQPVPRR